MVTIIPLAQKKKKAQELLLSLKWYPVGDLNPTDLGLRTTLLFQAELTGHIKWYGRRDLNPPHPATALCLGNRTGTPARIINDNNIPSYLEMSSV